ncbi:hypothetical protein CLAFUW4_01152 [Fulvia fulva]|uniref:Methyltransferase domain-containing protein n=1 Tax=Passalora fulva TaxID=5499 RepID=A0A9Q8L775_PASFU|nr:uncharacterized protein CLAFUR5_01157 [Fulvia fulva]KAK4636280.1 hypothetical protein CLAFUR4_01153 [Fulvia fulva]KAK4636404.1 hypothetical protein CLAFUR0_01154 [Fulvia fulva]UJO12123.1 hypothetical protein CLAFUR5_01157 [Fulvia fulva]WPV08885.1 hypothetical protein CLAFUW4_01152 [Fulvia fulva]WPV25290.1 hypothetical protein CLAFUW7_01157 [Fulvia fulva]
MNHLAPDANLFLSKHIPSSFHATPPSPQKVLHISCGTGDLTHQLAKKFTAAQVIGISPKSVDASRHGRLSNLMYIKATLEELVEREDMLFWPGTFDYIFQRGGMCSVEGWEEHIRMVVGLLGEGGMVEMQELGLEVFAGQGRDGIEEGSSLSEGWMWLTEAEKGAKGMGIDVRCGERLAGLFKEAGLEGVRDVVYRIPLRGPVVDEAGTDLQQTIKAHQDLLERFCSKGKSAEAISGLKENVAETLGRCEGGDFTQMHVVVGQKKSP